MIPRVVLGVAAVLLLLLPWPAPVSFSGLVTLTGAVLAVWAVRAPGSPAPMFLLATAVMAWLSAVPDPGLVRIAGFAAAGYVVHSAAALAAAVPDGAPLVGSLVGRWVAGTVTVLLAGWGVIALTALLTSLPGSAALVVVGMLAALTLVAIPAVVLRWSRS